MKKDKIKIVLRRLVLVLLDAAIVAFSFYFALLLRADGAGDAAWWPHNRDLLYSNLPWIIVLYLASFLAGGCTLPCGSMPESGICCVWPA